jgi:hypothetical protein
VKQPYPIIIDVVAVAVLAFGLYFPRYRRRDIVVAILGLNIGVMAVAIALEQSNVTVGLGFGLFGVLSIIRLRSQELDQEEVAYYFCALALGLLGGVRVTPNWVMPVLAAAILVALFVGDSPRLFPRTRHQEVMLDRAITDEDELTATLEALFGATVHRVKVRRVDLVNDTTNVDVRFSLRSSAESPA